MTISEIAQRAGVSKACVSRFFNHGYVSEEKKERIRAVIEETGYTPSRPTQTVRSGKTHTIGVVVPKIHSESISRITAGISDILNQNNYQMLLANTENDVSKELKYLQIFKDGTVEGIIFVATLLTQEHQDILRSLSIPIVIVGQYSDSYSCVYHDDYGAALAMTNQLLRAGCKRIGAILVTEKDRAAGADRRDGYLEAMRAANRPVYEKDIVCSGFTLESGYDAAQQLLEQSPHIDGIFCATDTIAIGAMQYLKGAGKRIPEDISITGIGHSRTTEIVSPRLTTAHYFYKTCGSEATDMLVKMIDSGIDMKKKLKLGFEIVEQETIRMESE